MGNGGNAPGIMSQAQGKPETPKESAQHESAKEVCEICEKEHPTPRTDKEGTHLRHKRLVNNVRNNHNFLNKNSWQEHPWYTAPACFQVHHLIDCQALKNFNWPAICRAFGYDINTAKNGVCLPAVPQLACFLRVPLHRGTHDTAKTNELADKTGMPHAAGSSGEAYLCYPAAVARYTDNLRKDLARSCATSDAFIARMDKTSAEIFAKVKRFDWHLRSDGHLYAASGPGCGEDSAERYGPCRSRRSTDDQQDSVLGRIKRHVQDRAHTALAKHLAAKPPFQLQLGK